MSQATGIKKGTPLFVHSLNPSSQERPLPTRTGCQEERQVLILGERLLEIRRQHMIPGWMAGAEAATQAVTASVLSGSAAAAITGVAAGPAALTAACTVLADTTIRSVFDGIRHEIEQGMYDRTSALMTHVFAHNRTLAEQCEQRLSEGSEGVRTFLQEQPIFNRPDFEAIPAKLQPRLLAFYAEALERKHEAAILALKGNLEGVETGLQDHIQTFCSAMERVDLQANQTFVRQQQLQNCMKHIATSLTTMGEGIQLLAEGVEGNSQKIGILRNDVRFMQEFMFGRMPPAEQLKALQSGTFFRDMSPEDKERLETKVKILEARQELAELSNEVAQGAQFFGELAGVLQLKPSVQRGCALVGNTAGAVASLASGNFWAAGMQVMSMFRRRDKLAGLRHRAVMQALAGLADGQRQIMHNQQRIYQAIQGVAEMIRKHHVAVMDALCLNRVEIRLNRRILQELANKKLKKIHAFFNSRSVYGFEDGKFLSYQDERDHFSASYKPFNKAFEAYIQLVSEPELPVQLSLETTLTHDSAELLRFKDEIWKPLLKWIRGPGQDRILANLILPATHSGMLDRMWEHSASIEIPEKDPRLDYARANLQALASPTAVCHHGNILLSMHRTAAIRNPSKRFKGLLSEGKLDRGNWRIPVNVLKSFLPIADLAIAQLYLQAGGGVLPGIYDVLAQKQRGESVDEDRCQLALQLIKTNPTLRHNLGFYLVHRELKATSNSEDSYRIALFHTSGMAEAFSTPWELVAAGDRQWKVRLGDDVQIDLPSGDAMKEGSLFFPSSLSSCLAIRSQLNDHLLDYSIEDSLPPELADLLKAGLQEPKERADADPAGKGEETGDPS